MGRIQVNHARRTPNTGFCVFAAALQNHLPWSSNDCRLRDRKNRRKNRSIRTNNQHRPVSSMHRNCNGHTGHVLVCSVHQRVFSGVQHDTLWNNGWSKSFQMEQNSLGNNLCGSYCVSGSNVCACVKLFLEKTVFTKRIKLHQFYTDENFFGNTNSHDSSHYPFFCVNYDQSLVNS